MELLIPLINKLQNVFSTVGTETLELPQIVVVGTQSSGKSSVLENLVGRTFLPRGTGIVTRRPLVLQLVHTKKQQLKITTEEWAEFQHRKNYVFTNFEDIREEIEYETNKVAGSNKGISDEPIFLRVYSSKVVDLTLVDLPGLTKVPVGDQPLDIETRIKDLVLSYIENPNAIILAIVTANTDMATNESLQLARECDPAGARTIAVVTKLDLMDSGTDATEILCGRVIPVKLGIIGVVNRSQRDTISLKSIQDALRDEAIFFQKKYSDLAHRNGTPYLAKRLNRILVNHIKACLPNLKSRIIKMKKQCLDKLCMYGEDLTDKSGMLLHVMSCFSTAYCSALDGTSRHIQTSELCGGARMCYIFHETFGKALDTIQPLHGLSKMDILTALRNATGTRTALFVPQICFELLVKKQIARLEEPSLRCAELIHHEMQRIIQHCGSEVQTEMMRFPKLFDKIVNTVSDLLQRRLPETNNMVQNVIQMELAYINTMHPDFRRDADSLVNLERPNIETEPEKMKSSSKIPNSHNGIWSSAAIYPTRQILERHSIPLIVTSKECSKFENTSDILRFGDLSARKMTDREKKECYIIEKLIIYYFNIVKRSVQDSVPKAIMLSMVNYVKENLQRELLQILYTDNVVEELLREPEHVINAREEAKVLLAALQRAESLLTDIQEMSF